MRAHALQRLLVGTPKRSLLLAIVNLIIKWSTLMCSDNRSSDNRVLYCMDCTYVISIGSVCKCWIDCSLPSSLPPSLPSSSLPPSLTPSIPPSLPLPSLPSSSLPPSLPLPSLPSSSLPPSLPIHLPQWWHSDGEHSKTLLLKGAFGKYIRFSPDFQTFVTIDNAGLLYVLIPLNCEP